MPTVAVPGSPDRSTDMSALPATLIVAVPVLFAVLVSLVAPVVTVTIDMPGVVGVPETGHEIDVPAATVAGGTGAQTPTRTPAGSPEIEHVADVAAAVAAALFVHLTTPA